MNSETRRTATTASRPLCGRALLRLPAITDKASWVLSQLTSTITRRNIWTLFRLFRRLCNVMSEQDNDVVNIDTNQATYRMLQERSLNRWCVFRGFLWFLLIEFDTWRRISSASTIPHVSPSDFSRIRRDQRRSTKPRCTWIVVEHVCASLGALRFVQFCVSLISFRLYKKHAHIRPTFCWRQSCVDTQLLSTLPRPCLISLTRKGSRFFFSFFVCRQGGEDREFGQHVGGTDLDLRLVGYRLPFLFRQECGPFLCACKACDFLSCIIVYLVFFSVVQKKVTRARFECGCRRACPWMHLLHFGVSYLRCVLSVRHSGLPHEGVSGYGWQVADKVHAPWNCRLDGQISQVSHHLECETSAIGTWYVSVSCMHMWGTCWWVAQRCEPGARKFRENAQDRALGQRYFLCCILILWGFRGSVEVSRNVTGPGHSFRRRAWGCRRKSQGRVDLQWCEVLHSLMCIGHEVGCNLNVNRHRREKGEARWTKGTRNFAEGCWPRKKGEEQRKQNGHGEQGPRIVMLQQRWHKTKNFDTYLKLSLSSAVRHWLTPSCRSKRLQQIRIVVSSSVAGNACAVVFLKSSLWLRSTVVQLTTWSSVTWDPKLRRSEADGRRRMDHVESGSPLQVCLRSEVEAVRSEVWGDRHHGLGVVQRRGDDGAGCQRRVQEKKQASQTSVNKISLELINRVTHPYTHRDCRSQHQCLSQR